jgi:uncharacterized protein with FMN-binding domain
MPHVTNIFSINLVFPASKAYDGNYDGYYDAYSVHNKYKVIFEDFTYGV